MLHKVIINGLFFVLLSTGLVLNAQVGVNTNSPKATLDVVGTATDPAVLDGLIPPRITGDQLQSKTYTDDQNGAIVFVAEPASSPSGQTVNVTLKGLYFFDSLNDQWQYLTSEINTKNVFVNTNDPNTATIFDDQLPVVANDSTLIENSQYIYFGEDGSTWVWDGSAYIAYQQIIDLNVGERVSVYKTMSSTAANGTHLPASGLIELDGLIRVGLNRVNAAFYNPYILNISSSSINVTFTSQFQGATAENRYLVQASIPSGSNQGIDNNNLTYWSTTVTETLTSNIILPNGKWYEIEWFAFELSGLKHIYMTVERKF